MRTVHWFTTNPSGKAHTHSADDGQTGWKLHAIVADDVLTLDDIKHHRALCGLAARHGWGLDLFIDAKCKRCTERESRLMQETAHAN